jgi:hypothetical protein
MDSPEALSSNILSNIALESDCTEPVKAWVRRPVMSLAMIVFMISLVPPQVYAVPLPADRYAIATGG